MTPEQMEKLLLEISNVRYAIWEKNHNGIEPLAEISIREALKLLDLAKLAMERAIIHQSQALAARR